MGLLTWGGVAVFSPASGEGNASSDQRPVAASAFEVSYAGAASRLPARQSSGKDGKEGTANPESTEQVRDWARFGLAAYLGMGTGSLRDASYDTLPVRDAGFDGLVRQPTGPGRSLFDSRSNTLHVLVPRDDRHKARTVGLQIDQHRTDAGSDARTVQVYEYTLQPGARTVLFTPHRPAPTAQVRARYGFVTQRVDTAAGLKDFLARTDRLSSLRTSGHEITASGWRWGGRPPVDFEDVSALQRAYSATYGASPGFSLDPKRAKGAPDIRAAFPGLKPELADGIAAGKPPAGLAEKVKNALFKGADAATLRQAGLPTDRTQLWDLYEVLQGGPAYAQARYDGPLAGTKVGMTLFYADYVAKHWVTGAGAGVPSKAVGGFVADPQADIPWSECARTRDHESARLWFGQNTSGFSYSGDRVDIGAQPTRLFARSNTDGAEVEPSYAMGRGLRWWDQHYQDVADYEPQYGRLDEIMRWSGALDWLRGRQDGSALPRPGSDRITSDLRFKDWYAHNDRLRERGRIAFVSPPSAGEEALHNAASKTYKQCGYLNIKGGVTLADGLALSSGHERRPDLPYGVRRAGLFDPASTYDGATGEGRITQVWKDTGRKVTDSVRRTFSRGKHGSANVRTVGGHRNVYPLGDVERVQDGNAGREVGSEISAGGDVARQSVELNGRPLGRMTAARTGGVVEVRWERGLMDRYRSAAGTIQKRMAGGQGGGAPPGADDVPYGYKDGDGHPQYKMGGKGDPWLSVVKGSAAAGAVAALRLGEPKQGGGGADFSTAALVPPDRGGPGSPRGPPGDGWFEVTPPSGDGPAMAAPAKRPRDDGSAIRVEAAGGVAHVYDVGGRPRAEANDPVVGLNGTETGAAFLRDFSRVRTALNEAGQAGDGLSRAVALGPDGSDGFALAGPGRKAVLVTPHDKWAGKLYQALAGDASVAGPLIRLTKDDGPRHIGKNSLTLAKDKKPRTMRLGEAVRKHPGDLYVSSRLDAQAFGGRPGFPAGPPAHDVTVVVVEARVDRERGSDESDTARPDAYRFRGEEWTRVGPGGGDSGNGASGNGGGSGGGSGGGTGGGGAGGGSRAQRVPLTGTVVLACTPHESDRLCDDQ
ncbi:hypothetical protein [Streptomyces sp. ODS28]|uniref:hypothetical protein n=1 Tax=Streptomyces sp. ODS28 TaxID=3136688 RepID=UPI0031EDBACF